jgi:hypothetical protein
MEKYLFEVGQHLADVFYNQENIKPLNQSKMKTAVEFLVEELLSGKPLMPSLIEQAKELEKQHIVDAHLKGQREDIDFINEAKQEAEQYYNTTFKSE